MRITVLDQDKERGEAACAALRAIGHRCTLAADASAMPALGSGEEPDLIILDDTVGAPSTLVERLRQSFPASPILLASMRASEDEIVAALAAGASDYMFKPVRQGDIVARVQVLLKRTYPEHHADELQRFGPYAFETAAARITHDEKSIVVTQKEFDLALLFFRNLGRPLSRTYIREVIWPGESELPSRTLDTHVSRVRSKLGLRPESGYRLAPVYSFGYQLEQLRT
jgi:DNA-binding response OmpR family regulator